MSFTEKELAEIEQRKKALRESVALFFTEMSGEVGESPVPLRLFSAQFNRRIMNLWRLTAGEWLRGQPDYFVYRDVKTGSSFVFLREFLASGEEGPMSDAQLRRQAELFFSRDP